MIMARACTVNDRQTIRIAQPCQLPQKGSFFRLREKLPLHRSMREFVSHIPVQHRRSRTCTETALYEGFMGELAAGAVTNDAGRLSIQEHERPELAVHRVESAEATGIGFASSVVAGARYRIPFHDLRAGYAPGCRWPSRHEGTTQPRYRARARKLTAHQESAIRVLAGTRRLRSLAADFGVSHETIRAVLRQVRPASGRAL
jgi:hypothetical protein